MSTLIRLTNVSFYSPTHTLSLSLRFRYWRGDKIQICLFAITHSVAILSSIHNRKTENELMVGALKCVAIAKRKSESENLFQMIIRDYAWIFPDGHKNYGRHFMYIIRERDIEWNTWAKYIYISVLSLVLCESTSLNRQWIPFVMIPIFISLR